MGMEMPAPLHWVLGFLGLDAWPKADEDALREMSAAYSAASQSVRAAADRTDNGANNLVSVIEGDVGQAMTKYFGDIAGSGGLGGIADDLALCGQACEQTADATFEGKVEYVASVAMFAAVVAQALATGPFTLGASTAEIPIAAAVTRVALWQIVKRLVAENAAAVAKQVFTKAAGKVALTGAKNFGTAAGIEGLKEGVVTLGTGENHFDASKIIAQGAINAVVAPVSKKIMGVKERDPQVSRSWGEKRVDSGKDSLQAMPASVALKQGIHQGHEIVSPETADESKPTKTSDALHAVPSAIANIPEAIKSVSIQSPYGLTPLQPEPQNPEPGDPVPGAPRLNLDTADDRAPGG